MYQTKKETLIDNTYMGERIEFYQLGENTTSTFIEYYHYMFWQGSGYLQEHIHPFHDEEYEVLKGTATYFINGKKFKATAGSKITIPKGKRHVNPFNNGHKELVVKRTDPVDLNNEYFYRKLYQMAYNGKFSKVGIPNTSQLLALTSLTKNNTLFTAIPRIIQRPILTLFNRLLIKQVA